MTPDLGELTELFNEQFPDLDIGGFYNPIVKFVGENGDIEFACNYDGYDQFDEELGWTWFFDHHTRLFYN